MKNKVRIATSITFRTFAYLSLAAAVILMCPLSNAEATTVRVDGGYSVIVQYGDGTTHDLGAFSFKSDSSDALEYNETQSMEGGSASAAFGMWATGNSSYWAFWLTDGTGVGQIDPTHSIGETRMTIAYDVKIHDPDIGDSNGQYAAWYDQNFLRGTVGAEGSVGFINDAEAFIGKGPDDEKLFNTLYWSYLNQTPGAFYIDSGQLLPNPDRREFLADGQYMRFIGTYTFFANNDGGPSAIHFTENAPPPVPEPTTLLLLGSGLLTMSFLGRKKRI